MSPSCARVCQNRGNGSNTGKDYRVEPVSHFVQSLIAFTKITGSMFHTNGSTKNNFTFLHPVFTSSSSDLKPQVSEDSENIKIACYSISFCDLRSNKSNMNPGANSAKLFFVEPYANHYCTIILRCILHHIGEHCQLKT